MFRRYFIAGLLVLLPIWVTLLIINFMVGLVDQSLSLLPRSYQPDHILGMHIPGLGIIFTIAFVFLTGMLVTNFIGNWVISVWESFLSRIPLVRSIYTAVKQVLNTVFSSSGESFRKVLLVEYPRKEMWSIAFQTGSGLVLPGSDATTDELVTVYIPTTPNPTSGFLLLVPRHQVVELKMSIEQALKLVISLGVVMPPSLADQMVNRRHKESM
jgi:uncharacterized membrane protein